MCGRVFQKNALGLAIVTDTKIEPAAKRSKARYNGAPRQELLIIRRHPKTRKPTMSTARWGLIHHSNKELPKIRPINATAETLGRILPFADAYANQRCILPIHGFFEWKAINGANTKQPYAIAMTDGRPFGVAGIWENWKNPITGHWIRTFCVITCPANSLVAQIHVRMPVIIGEAFYNRWLGKQREADALLKPFPADLMTMWPVSTRVNSLGNDDAGLLDRIMEKVECEGRPEAFNSYGHGAGTGAQTSRAG